MVTSHTIHLSEVSLAMKDDNALLGRLVDDLLSQSGLVVTSEEREWLIQVQRIQRVMADRLRVTEVQNVAPAVMSAPPEPEIP